MLREIQHVRQERKKDRRRWFTDDHWDLYVWIRKDGSYSGFQLCYGKPDSEHALTWMDGSDPTHAPVIRLGETATVGRVEQYWRRETLT